MNRMTSSFERISWMYPSTEKRNNYFGVVLQLNMPEYFESLSV
jgi:hypothetical protein